MRSVNIHKAKTHLSSLVQEVAESGEAIIIAKAGKPIVKVVPIDSSDDRPARLGFLAGKAEIPEDFDTMGANEVSDLFYK